MRRLILVMRVGLIKSREGGSKNYWKYNTIYIYAEITILIYALHLIISNFRLFLKEERLQN